MCKALARPLHTCATLLRKRLFRSITWPSSQKPRLSPPSVSGLPALPLPGEVRRPHLGSEGRVAVRPQTCCLTRGGRWGVGGRGVAAVPVGFRSLSVIPGLLETASGGAAPLLFRKVQLNLDYRELRLRLVPRAQRTPELLLRKTVYLHCGYL